MCRRSGRRRLRTFQLLPHPPWQSARPRLTGIAGVTALLGAKLDGMAGVDTDPLAGVANLHPGQLAGVPSLEEEVLESVTGTHRRLLQRAGPGRLLMLGDMAVGQRRVLLDVTVAERPVGCQVLSRHPAMILDVPVLRPCMLGGVPVDEAGLGPGLFRRHSAHLTRPGVTDATVALSADVLDQPARRAAWSTPPGFC
jgi:hypothetical protein